MRLKIFCSALLLLMFNVALVYAQVDNPCDGSDPDLTCSLDTRVFVLAGAAVILTVVRLYRKQKT
jgi:hypothetical protein